MAFKQGYERMKGRFVPVMFSRQEGRFLIAAMSAVIPSETSAANAARTRVLFAARGHARRVESRLSQDRPSRRSSLADTAFVFC